MNTNSHMEHNTQTTTGNARIDGGFAAKGWYGWNGAAWEKLNP